jgi:hypothetical protein
LGIVSHFWDNGGTVSRMTTILRVVDYDIAERPQPADLAKLSTQLSNVLTSELDGAQRYLRLPTEEILLAALGRTIARTIGDGVVTVDLTRKDRSVPLACVSSRLASATEMLGAVHATLATAPRHRNGHRRSQPRSDVFFSVGIVREPASGETLPGFRYALEVQVSRSAGLLCLDWCYDTRGFERSTVEDLSEQFPLALIEITSEAIPPIHGGTELAMAT